MNREALKLFPDGMSVCVYDTEQRFLFSFGMIVGVVRREFAQCRLDLVVQIRRGRQFFFIAKDPPHPRRNAAASLLHALRAPLSRSFGHALFSELLTTRSAESRFCGWIFE